jgi:RimJ/RimL family protein N-acetyltransferase
LVDRLGDDLTEVRGIVDGRNLVAVGSLSVWDGGVGHIGVFTRAESRGRGLAGAVTTPLVTEAFDRGLVAQWRSRFGNDASAAVADRLGFVALGHQMFVRVRPQPR